MTEIILVAIVLDAVLILFSVLVVDKQVHSDVFHVAMQIINGIVL